MRMITKRSRWGHREFIVINRWPGPRWSRHQQTCGTVSARVGHSKRIYLSELSSFRTIEGACSRLLPSHAPLVQSGVKDKYRKLRAVCWRGRSAEIALPVLLL